MVGLTSIASSVAGMLVQRKLGELNDRWGARRLTVLSGLLIPILPLLWVFIPSAWFVIPINLLSGALWGAYGMGSFNHLLMIMPADQRARYSAIFQVTVTLALAGGAALGSLLVTQWGYPAVFVSSSIGRFIAALLFARLSRQRARLAKPAGGVGKRPRDAGCSLKGQASWSPSRCTSPLLYRIFIPIYPLFCDNGCYIGAPDNSERWLFHLFPRAGFRVTITEVNPDYYNPISQLMRWLELSKKPAYPGSW